MSASWLSQGQHVYRPDSASFRKPHYVCVIAYGRILFTVTQRTKLELISKRDRCIPLLCVRCYMVSVSTIESRANGLRASPPVRVVAGPWLFSVKVLELSIWTKES